MTMLFAQSMSHFSTRSLARRPAPYATTLSLLSIISDFHLNFDRCWRRIPFIALRLFRTAIWSDSAAAVCMHSRSLPVASSILE
jgi:hypothetical protein